MENKNYINIKFKGKFYYKILYILINPFDFSFLGRIKFNNQFYNIDNININFLGKNKYIYHINNSNTLNGINILKTNFKKTISINRYDKKNSTYC